MNSDSGQRLLYISRLGRFLELDNTCFKINSYGRRVDSEELKFRLAVKMTDLDTGGRDHWMYLGLEDLDFNYICWK